jgi:tRNA (guanine37-N1)-methyltransferase
LGEVAVLFDLFNPLRHATALERVLIFLRGFYDTIIKTMRFDIISIFPESFASYFDASILKRARSKGLIEIFIHNLRDFTHDKHKTVDDTPYGGGAGMVFKIEPIWQCLQFLKPKTKNQKLPPKADQPLAEKTRIILFSAKGKTFMQADARRLTKYERLILICGRYEGVDERIAEHFVDEELSIGDYVLTGGEIPAMVVVDAVTRLIPGVLGNIESAKTESHSEKGIVEYPQYTKPDIFQGMKVPDILLSGNHKEIEKWRKEQSKQQSMKNKNVK